MTDSERYDVVVIGAGLAGLRCAHLLGQSGLQVLLVDRKSSLQSSIHTTGIFVRRTLEDFGLPESCLGPPVRHVTLYSPRRRALRLVSSHDEFRVGRMGPLYQRYLDLCRAAGVEWWPGSRFSGCDVRHDGLTVRLERSGVPRRVTTRYLVGADGANSRVAQALGLELNRSWIVGAEEVCRDAVMGGPPQFHCFLDPELAPGYLAWLVHDGEETHIGVAGYPERFDPLSALKKFRAGLGDLIDLDHAELVDRRGGRIPVGGILRSIANRHGLLIGDAAGAVSPLTAGGLDPCLRLSTLAAGVIHRFLAGDEQALASYAGDRFRARFVSRLLMRRIAANVRHRSLLELGCFGLRLPIINGFARHVFFGRGSFPDVVTDAGTAFQAA
jgi:flavin-dependent dehydrogenase